MGTGISAGAGRARRFRWRSSTRGGGGAVETRQTPRGSGCSTGSAAAADRGGTGGLGSARYSRPEIRIVAIQPRPYSPMTLFLASGPVNQADVVNISPAARPVAQAVTAAGEK